MNRRTLILGTSVLGLATFAGGAFYVNRQRATEAEAAAALAEAAPPVAETLLIRPQSPVLGPNDARSRGSSSSIRPAKPAAPSLRC